MVAFAACLRETQRALRHPQTREGILLAGSQYVAACLGFLTSAAAARLLGPTDYGIAVLAMAYPGLLWSIVDAKSSSVVTRYIASFRATGRKNELLSICKLGFAVDFLLAMSAVILVGATGWWAARFMYDTQHSFWLMMAYAVSFPFSSLAGTSWAILSSWRRFRCLAGFQILDKGITLLAVTGLLAAGLGVPAIVLGIAMGHIFHGVVMVSAASSVLYRDGLGPWWKAPLDDIASLRKELSAFFGWSYLIVTFSGLVGQVPLLLLGRFHGPEQAGFYRLAINLITVGSYLETSLGRVAYPIISARWCTEDRAHLMGALKRCTLLAGVPLGSLLICIIVLIPSLVPLIFGSAYSPIVPGVQIMMVGTAVSTVFFLWTSFYYASGRIDLWTKAYGFYTVLVIGLGAFCIQRWGFFGLANVIGLGKILFTMLLVVIFMTVWQKSK
jgi:O-antigen/teichoic acid export membrane protein